jgi:hypothetical protein
LTHNKKNNETGKLSELRRRKGRHSSEETAQSQIKSSISDKTRKEIYSNDEGTDNIDKLDEHEEMEERSANRFKRTLNPASYRAGLKQD